MEGWSRRLPVRIHPTVTTRQFVVAVALLTVAGFLITYAALEHMDPSTGYILVLGIQAILLVNAFLPHLAATIRFRMYSPGVVTAVLITIPFSYYLFRRALTSDILTWTHFWILLALAPFAMVLFAALALQIGKGFDL